MLGCNGSEARDTALSNPPGGYTGSMSLEKMCVANSIAPWVVLVMWALRSRLLPGLPGGEGVSRIPVAPTLDFVPN